MIRAGWLIRCTVLFALVGFVPSPLSAAELETQTSPEQASKFVKDLGSRTVTLLTKYSDGDAPEFQTQLRNLIQQSFDLDLIGRFVLGAAWRTATPGQQKEYQELFALWTADNYARRLGTDRGGSLTVTGAEPQSGSADAVVQTTINRSDGVSIDTNLRVRDSQGQMKIIDVTMGGVSMNVTQRDEFASVIQQKGLDGLISDLRSHVNGLRVEAAQR